MFEKQQRALRIGLATAAMVGIAAVPTVVMASSSGGLHLVDPAITAQTVPTPTGTPGTKPARPNPHAALATALGVTPEALKAAMEAARTAVGKPDPATLKDEAGRKAFEAKFVAALAANLKLDVAKVQAALDAAKPQGIPGRHGPKGDHGVPSGQRFALRAFGIRAFDKVATALGVTEDALKAAVKAGIESAGKPDAATLRDQAARDAYQAKVLTAVAANLKIDVSKLQAAIDSVKAAAKAEMRAALVQRLAAAVTAGKLTQAQADQMLADFDAGKLPAHAPKPALQNQDGQRKPGFEGRRPGAQGQGQQGSGQAAPKQNAG